MAMRMASLCMLLAACSPGSSAPDLGPPPDCVLVPTNLNGGDSDGNGWLTDSTGQTALCHVAVHGYLSHETRPYNQMLLMLGGHQVNGTLAMDRTTPDTSLNPSPFSCGTLVYSYSLPSKGCTQCMPNPPLVTYAAEASNDCLGDAQNVTGSWQIDLTASTYLTSDAAGDNYLVHGTLVANLLNGADTADLSLSF
jgi:hypothetical protein